MATVKVRNSIKVTLFLTEEEARWLLRVMQNPVHEQEDKTSSEVRCSIFTALNVRELGV